MKLPAFVDLAPLMPDASGFVSTNESLDVHRKLLDKIPGRLASAASIASGGEIAMLALLPKCDKVIAVDHSYRALVSCYVRLILLQTWGLRGLQERLKIIDTTKIDYQKHKAATQVFAQDILFTRHYLPEGLAGKVSFNFKDYSNPIDMDGVRGLCQWWMDLPQDRADELLGSMDRITFVKCDFYQLALYYDPFDLIYISNMLDHGRQNQIAHDVDKLRVLLKPKGWLLGTSFPRFTSANPEKDSWRFVTPEDITIQGSVYNGSYKWPKLPEEYTSCGWTHHLHQAIEPEGVANGI